MPLVELPSGQLRDEIRMPLYDDISFMDVKSAYPKSLLNSQYGKFTGDPMKIAKKPKKMSLTEKLQIQEQNYNELLRQFEVRGAKIRELEWKLELHQRYLSVMERQR